jgi:hypothetical protein
VRGRRRGARRRRSASPFVNRVRWRRRTRRRKGVRGRRGRTGAAAGEQRDARVARTGTGNREWLHDVLQPARTKIAPAGNGCALRGGRPCRARDCLFGVEGALRLCENGALSEHQYSRSTHYQTDEDAACSCSYNLTQVR